MKKIFFYSLTLATVIACNTLEVETLPSGKGDDVVPGMITEIVSGNRGVSSKATISNDDAPAFAWTAGDNVAVHVSNGTTGQYVFTSDPGAEGAINPSASSAKFKVVYPEGYSRDAFAVFPSTIVSDCSTAESNYGQSGHTLDVTLPSTYTLAQVSGAEGLTSPCPMIATNAVGSGWEFYQLCSLLRLTINCIPKGTKRLEIDFNGKKVWGNFSIASPVVADGTENSSVIATSADADHDVIKIIKDGSDSPMFTGKLNGQVINVWKDGLVLNIPLPTGEYTDITVTAYKELEGGNAVLMMTRSFDYTATRLKSVKKTTSFPVFSVNSDRSTRVIFASGNLQATTNDNGTTWTWGFAEHQFDFLGSGGANTKIDGNGTVSENGTVDLFGYSTANNYYGISTSSGDYSGSFKDWGTIEGIAGKPAGYWRTMSTGNNNDREWWYMMRNRPTENRSYTRAVINTDGTPVNGIILFPDYYDGGTPEGVTTWGNLMNSYAAGSFDNGAKCTGAGWAALEDAGCVFLPAAGYRNGSTFTSEELRYGTCSPRNDNLWYILSFKNGEMIYWNEDGKYKRHGYSVRLVHEVN